MTKQVFNYQGRKFRRPASVLRAMQTSGRIPTETDLHLALDCAMQANTMQAFDMMREIIDRFYFLQVPSRA